MWDGVQELVSMAKGPSWTTFLVPCDPVVSAERKNVLKRRKALYCRGLAGRSGGVSRVTTCRQLPCCGWNMTVACTRTRNIRFVVIDHHTQVRRWLIVFHPLQQCRLAPTPNKSAKNYGTRDSRMVTHSSTNQAIRCLNMAEQTGSLVFIVL